MLGIDGETNSDSAKRAGDEPGCQTSINQLRPRPRLRPEGGRTFLNRAGSSIDRARDEFLWADQGDVPFWPLTALGCCADESLC